MAQFTYKGIDIDVDHNGYFKAIVDGAELIKQTLAQLQTEIDLEIKANIKNVTISLPVTGIVSGGTPANRTLSIAHGTITAIHRNTGALVISGNPHNWLHVVPDSEANRQLCAEYTEVLNRYNSLQKAIGRLQIRSPASGRVSHDEYTTRINELVRQYNTAAAPPKPAEEIKCAP